MSGGAALLAGDPRSQPQCEGALRSSLIKGPLPSMVHRLFELGTGVTWPNQEMERQPNRMIITDPAPSRASETGAELIHFLIHMQLLLPEKLLKAEHGQSGPNEPWHPILSFSGLPDCVRALLKIRHARKVPGKS